MGLIKMAAAGAAGYAVYKYATREKEAAHAGYTDVRDSGPENMASTPKHWSKTDEASDQSFPASDPPSNY